MNSILPGIFSENSFAAVVFKLVFMFKIHSYSAPPSARHSVGVELPPQGEFPSTHPIRGRLMGTTQHLNASCVLGEKHQDEENLASYCVGMAFLVGKGYMGKE